MNDDGVKRSKWMVNILNEPKHRTRYVQMLEKLTPSPFITFARLLISLAALTVLIIISTVIMLQPSGKLFYTAVWVVAGTIAMVVLIALYALPHRSHSLITSAMRLFSANTIAKTLGIKSKLSSIGIEGLTENKDGSGECLLLFDDGEIGKVYKIDGGVGMSTLPAVAEATRTARYQYLIGRSSSTREMLLTLVSPAQFTSQLSTLKSMVNDTMKTDNPNSSENIWRRHMCVAMYEYMYDNMRNDDTIIEQYIIIREENDQRLLAACRLFENSVYSGMYARAVPLSVEKTQEILDRLTATAQKNHTNDGLTKQVLEVK